MNSKPTPKERAHLQRIKELPCSVCDAPGPSEAHHIEQRLQYTCVALCADCHRGSHNGLHGRRAKCKVCGTEFVRVRPLQQVCSQACAIVHVKALAAKDAKAKARIERERVKADRKATREKLDALRTKPQLTKMAQQAFNAYIRARDAGKPCICCGKPLGTEPNSYDAGHYRSVGSAPHMRFVEANVHGQSKYCNQHLAGNHVEYRRGLIARIGLEAVEALEADQTQRKYTRDALIDLARRYRELTRKIKAENQLKEKP